MSGAGENRSSWQRPQGRGNRASASNNQNKDGGRQQGTSPASGNVWKGKGAPGAQNQNQNQNQNQAQAQAQPQASTPSVPAEPHVPVKGFNAGEVREFLKKKYLESVADQPSAYHKVQGDSVAKRSSGAWGSRGNMPHLMPSGQDFFTQLKKQLAALDQAKS